VKKILLAIALAFGLTLGVAACSTGESYSVTDETVIIDVRTAEEFATGHLVGAINIDVQSADFRDRVMAFDTDGEYFIYCRSGNRSGQAITQMFQMGFTDMTNGGSVQEASNMTSISVIVP
jgi:rhodanese-related sulfurtransferase